MAPRGDRRADAGRVPARSGPRVPVRRHYLDNLKTLLIAVIIVVHAVIGYADFPGAWPYSDVHEAHLAWPTVVAVFGLAAPALLLMIPLLFCVAGLLAAPSLDRRGPGVFARGRLLRLGLPFAAFLLVWPALQYALYRPLGHVHGSLWAYFRQDFPDSGPLWFVGLLLLVSLGYAGWRVVRQEPSAQPPPLTARRLLLVAAGVAAGSFVLRLAWPYGSSTPLSLNEWQWPECFGLFGVGVAAARRGWTEAVPRQLARTARRTTAITSGATAVFLAGSLPLGVGSAEILGGRHWAALAVDCAEGLLTVFGSIWVLAVAQRRLERPFRFGPALARSAYAAFLVQGFVLIGLAVALRPLPVAAGAKAFTVAALGVLLSFALGRVIVTQVPPLARVL